MMKAVILAVSVLWLEIKPCLDLNLLKLNILYHTCATAKPLLKMPQLAMFKADDCSHK